MAARVAFESDEAAARADSRSNADKVHFFASSRVEEKDAPDDLKDAPDHERAKSPVDGAVAGEADTLSPPARYERFYDVFGSLGVPMVLCFLISAGVSFWFAVMQLFPLEAMNLLMGTGHLDYGHFWMPAEASLSTKCLAALALALFGVGYIWLILFMIALFDFPKLVFHSLNLKDFLAQGFPLPIIFFYAALLLANWLIALYRFQHRNIDRKCVVRRMSLLFDLFFAVFAPFFVFAYAYFNFHLDRELFQIREETLMAGAFGRIARMFADPIELTVFRLGFQNLQILTIERLLIKSFLNLLGLTKWNQLIRHLVRVNDEDRHRTSITAIPTARYRSCRHIWAAVAVFALCISGTTVTVLQSIKSSIDNCAPYPQCGLISYRWDWNTDHLCPCIAFIDRNNLAPKSFSEWANPPDATAALAAVSQAGLLDIVQIINRKLVNLPEALLRCKKLHYLILIYTKTKRIPDWAKQFSSLEYFHVEVSTVDLDLEYLPPDLFSLTSNIRFIRIGRAARLQELPSLTGLTKLSSLILTGMYSLREFPSFDDLTEVSTLYIIDITHVRTLPSMKNLRNLNSFSLSRRMEMCCNGFITGTCNLSDFQCLPREGEPVVECILDRIPVADLALISGVKGLVCSKNLTIDLTEGDPTLETSDVACGGVMYRECFVGNRRGMCYNTRMQVIACDFLGEHESMRRLEIARGVGEKCDPAVEAWLGCVS